MCGFLFFNNLNLIILDLNQNIILFYTLYLFSDSK